MKKIPVLLLLLIIIILIASIITIYLYSIPVKVSSQPKYKQTWNQSTLSNLQVNENVVGYILTKLEANKLHNVPLTKNTPKIEIVIDDETFSAEVNSGKINVKKGQIANADIKIIMVRQDVINILNSSDQVKEIEKSINSGTMELEVIASRSELLSKGYLSLYEKFSGENLEI
ncbi:MAG: hypothetical protein QXI33_00860 [Candidatus Pacearchaeota archaeon]